MRDTQLCCFASVSQYFLFTNLWVDFGAQALAIFNPYFHKLALPQEWRRQIQRQTSDCFRLPWQELSDSGGAWVVFVENNLRSYFSISLIRTLGAGGGLADTSSWSPSSSLNNAATPRPLGCTLVTLSHIAHLFYTRPMLNKTNGKLRSIS